MKTIVQLELTNHCNRRCHYCGQTNMTRAKGFASPEIVTRCIEIMKRLGQPTVGLNHYGESLLHPEFLAIVAKFNASSIKPWVYTNGDFLPHIVADLAKMKLHSLVISGHAPQDERAKLAEQCTSLGLPASWQHTVADNCVDIAGQVSIPGHASTSYSRIRQSTAGSFVMRWQSSFGTEILFRVVLIMMGRRFSATSLIP